MYINVSETESEQQDRENLNRQLHSAIECREVCLNQGSLSSSLVFLNHVAPKAWLHEARVVDDPVDRHTSRNLLQNALQA